MDEEEIPASTVTTLTRFIPRSISFTPDAQAYMFQRNALSQAFPIIQDADMFEHMEMVPLYSPARRRQPGERQHIKTRYKLLNQRVQDIVANRGVAALSARRMAFFHRRAVIDSLKNRFEELEPDQITSGARASDYDSAMTLRTHEEL